MLLFSVIFLGLLPFPVPLLASGESASGNHKSAKPLMAALSPEASAPSLPPFVKPSSAEPSRAAHQRASRDAKLSPSPIKVLISEGCLQKEALGESGNRGNELELQPGAPLVLTHRISLLPGSCGSGCEAEFSALRERLERLERELSTLREKCGGAEGGCCPPQPSTGAGCTLECPNFCSDQGRCEGGKCVCFPGFSGPDCSTTICPSDCNNRGKCVNGKCVCDAGFTGADCSESACPDNCKNRGRCVNGKCVCDAGFTGADCSESVCPDNCKNRGRCVNGKCVCDAGFTGADCSESACPNNCKNRGRCVNGKCMCDAGFTGADCSEAACPNNCKNRGRCVNGKCVCDAGFTGADCSETACPDNCKNRGRCVNGKCVCDAGFTGVDCSEAACPNNCKNRGRCVNGKCVCDAGFTGADCSEAACPNNCKNRGRCVNGKCVCDSGFTGADCSEAACPNNCNNKGRCVNGKCVCDVGFTGQDCSAKSCPGNCNNRGRCVKGKCVCRPGFTGPDCSECESGFTGPDCSTALTGVTQLRTRDVTDSSVTIFWTLPSVQYETYHITFTSKKEGDQKITSKVGGSLSSYTQVGLAAGQEYKVSIKGEIDGKMGQESTTSFTTLISGPKNLRVVKTTTTTAVVQWEAPLGDIDKYRLSVSPNKTEVEGKGSQEINLPPERDSAHIEGLQAGRLYDVSLMALKGRSQSQPITVQVTPGDSAKGVSRVAVETVTMAAEVKSEKTKEGQRGHTMPERTMPYKGREEGSQNKPKKGAGVQGSGNEGGTNRTTSDWSVTGHTRLKSKEKELISSKAGGQSLPPRKPKVTDLARYNGTKMGPGARERAGQGLPKQSGNLRPVEGTRERKTQMMNSKFRSPIVGNRTVSTTRISLRTSPLDKMNGTHARMGQLGGKLPHNGTKGSAAKKQVNGVRKDSSYAVKSSDSLTNRTEVLEQTVVAEKKHNNDTHGKKCAKTIEVLFGIVNENGTTLEKALGFPGNTTAFTDGPNSEVNKNVFDSLDSTDKVNSGLQVKSITSTKKGHLDADATRRMDSAKQGPQTAHPTMAKFSHHSQAPTYPPPPSALPLLPHPSLLPMSGQPIKETHMAKEGKPWPSHQHVEAPTVPGKTGEKEYARKEEATPRGDWNGTQVEASKTKMVKEGTSPTSRHLAPRNPHLRFTHTRPFLNRTQSNLKAPYDLSKGPFRRPMPPNGQNRNHTLGGRFMLNHHGKPGGHSTSHIYSNNKIYPNILNKRNNITNGKLTHGYTKPNDTSRPISFDTQTSSSSQGSSIMDEVSSGANSSKMGIYSAGTATGHTNGTRSGPRKAGPILGFVRVQDITSGGFTLMWEAPQGIFTKFIVSGRGGGGAEKQGGKDDTDREEVEDGTEEEDGSKAGVGVRPEKRGRDPATVRESWGRTDVQGKGSISGGAGTAPDSRAEPPHGPGRRLNDTRDKVLSHVLPGSARSFAFQNLRPQTRYSVSLFGTGPGVKSKIHNLAVTTGPEPPTDLIFNNVTESSLSVSWTKPTSRVTGFKVTYIHTLEGEPLSVTVDSKHSTVTLTQLSPGSSYEVSVISTLGMDESDPVKGVAVTVPDPPTDLRAINVTDSKALLLWRPALATVDGYIIVYGSGKGPDVTVTVSGNAAEQQLKGLQGSTPYTVTVTSRLDQQQSRKATTTFTTAGRSGDGEGPRDLRANQVTPRSAVLSWKAPSTAVTGYKLTYQTPGQELKEVTLDAAVTQHKLKRLLPVSKYTVHLQAERRGQFTAALSTEFTTGTLRFPFPTDCSQELLNGILDSDETEIYPEGPQGKPVTVYCDMETDGGGWTVFQRRMDGKTNFFRSWREYSHGFGNLSGEFWLGNALLHNLTSLQPMSLRVDLRSGPESVFAQYSSFSIDTMRKHYAIKVSGYSGTAGDSMMYHNGRPFSTRDRDYNPFITRCAMSYRGGWWYKNCHEANLNGLYDTHTNHQGVIWTDWKGKDFSIPFSEMKIRPASFSPPTQG